MPCLYSTKDTFLHPTEGRARALRLLQRAAYKAKRANVAFSREFIRTTNLLPGEKATPPLTKLIQGGRGGEVRLKLYLLLTMIATKAPYDIRTPPTAQTLGWMLDLAADTGARRINSNLRWLRDRAFISLTKRPAAPASIQLLNPHGTGEPLSSPRETRPYTSLPIGFWSQGWLLDLSPTAIAVLLALSERLGGATKPLYLLRDRRDSYGLSHDTWTRGEHELVRQGLLTVTRTPQGSEWDFRRLRNAYQINLGWLALRTPAVDIDLP